MKKSELLRKIRKEFPDLKWKTSRHNVEGWDHYVLILDNKYVFRFPRKEEYLKKLQGEIGILKYLNSKVNLLIPEYKFVAKDKSFAGYEMIHGLQLKKPFFKKLPAETKHLIARQLAEFLSILHSVPMNIARFKGAEEPNIPKEFRELQSNARKLVFPKISQKNRRLIEDYFKEFKFCLSFPKKVFMHTDLYPDHILLAQNKKSLLGVIDFSDQSIDDPAFEFCELWVYGREFIEEVYKFYKGPKDKDFLQRSILYYKRMALWMMISTFEDRKGSFRESYKLFKQVFLDKNYFA